MAEDVTGLRILICGATGGIGSAAVEGFAADGATVTALYHRAPPPPVLAGRAAWLQCDVTDKAAVDAVVDEAAGRMGGLDALINASGTWRGGTTPEAVTEADIDLLISANVKSTIYLNQAVFRHMQAAGGRIINFGSSEGVAGNPAGPVYSLTRGAVHSWTRSAAKAWGKHNITVNAVAPAMATQLSDYLFEQMDEAARQAFRTALKARIPLGGQLGQPLRDLYPMLRLLAGPGGRFITGQLLAVDGGLQMLGA